MNDDLRTEDLRCDVNSCDRPVIGADIGEAGDYYWCEAHAPRTGDWDGNEWAGER